MHAKGEGFGRIRVHAKREGRLGEGSAKLFWFRSRVSSLRGGFGAELSSSAIFFWIRWVMSACERRGFRSHSSAREARGSPRGGFGEIILVPVEGVVAAGRVRRRTLLQREILLVPVEARLG